MSGLGWVSSWFGGAVAQPGEQQRTQPQAEASRFRNEFRVEQDVGTVASIPSSPIGTLSEAGGGHDAGDVQNVAAAVRAAGKQRLQAAWRALKSEFDVTNKIWESVAMTQGGKNMAAERDRLRTSIEVALRAGDRDPVKSTKMLSPILQGVNTSAGQEQLLNQATVTAAQKVIKAERSWKLHDRLAGYVQATVDDPSRPKAKGSELESVVKTCKLKDSSLESRVRKILGMGASKEEKAQAAREEKAAQEAARDERIRQVAEVAGVSRDRARKAIENAGGDADLALIMLISDPDEAAKREKRIERKTAVAEKKRASAEAAAIAKLEAAQARIDESKQLALAIANLASSTPKMSWSKVRTEFDVQLKVWDTQALLCASSGAASVSYADTQSEMRGVLAAAERDPRAAVMMLEMVLQKAVERGLEICTGMVEAADAVLDTDSVACYRRELAGRLRDLSKSLEEGRGVPTRGAAQEQELADLISACQLKDSHVAIRVKMVLDPQNVSL